MCVYVLTFTLEDDTADSDCCLEGPLDEKIIPVPFTFVILKKIFDLCNFQRLTWFVVLHYLLLIKFSVLYVLFYFL